MKIKDYNLDQISGNVFLSKLQKDYWGTIELLLELVLPQFTISEVGITHRWITHWDKQGLISNRRDGASWRRFSFVEYIWLRIIVRLREFQMPLSAVKRVKKFLWQTPNLQKFDQIGDEFLQNVRMGLFPLPPGITEEGFRTELKKAEARQKLVFKLLNTLFWMIFSMQLFRRPVCLLINEKGSCGSIFLAGGEITESSLNILADEIPRTDFICLNLYKILQEFYSNEKIEAKIIQKISILNEKEKKILELIQKGDFKEISIKLMHNKEYLVGIKRNKSIDKISGEVSSIISRNKYQDIKLITQKGRIILAEITEKIKI
jgi:DNA-binding transcriptional MerR regulator